MGRVKCREGGLTKKEDTPVKTAPRRQGKCRRLLANKHYEAFPEEAEEMCFPAVTAVSPVLAAINPAHCRSASRSNSHAWTENPRGKAVRPAAPANTESGNQVSPAGHPTIQMTPNPEAFSVTPSSMESDVTFSSDGDDDDEEEVCLSSASTASSSLPSPEIFRRESYVETVTIPLKEELLGLHLHIKNSTLLDVSHAESIHMHHPPNLSTIIDTSVIVAEKNDEIKGPEAESRINTNSLKSDKFFKRKSPVKLPNRRPILYKKKVWFKSPLVAETFEAKHVPATKVTVLQAGEPVHTSSPAEQTEAGADTSRAAEMEPKEEPSCLTVTLKRPVKSNPESALFFDFADSDLDVFFQRMQERSRKSVKTPVKTQCQSEMPVCMPTNDM